MFKKKKEKKEYEGYIPKGNYKVTFSNGETAIIDNLTYEEIFESQVSGMSFLIFEQDMSTMNLSQIVSIKPLEKEN